MIAAVLCREFKWTWQEYMTQPQSFIDTITDMLTAEGKEQKRQARNKGGGR